MLEVVIVGSGNRVLKDFFPLLIYLHKIKKLKVIGVVNRTKANCELLLSYFKCNYYENLDELFKNNKQNLNVILSVKSKIKDNFVKYLVKKNCNILIDTPTSHSFKLLNKLSKYKYSICTAEDFLYNPIILRFLSVIKNLKSKKFQIYNKNFTTNYHFFSLIKYFVNEKTLHCKVETNLKPKDSILNEKINFSNITFKSETPLNKRDNLIDKELIYNDLENIRISSNEIIDQLAIEYAKRKDNLFLYLNEYLIKYKVFCQSDKLKFKKIMKLIGLKNVIEQWFLAITSKNKIFYSTDYASDILLLLKSSSISRILNISINPKKIKFLKNLL
jgi:hypothetical protein